MSIVVLPLVLGLAVGLARGGRLDALAKVKLFRPWLALAAVAALLAAALVPSLFMLGTVAALGCVAAFLAVNRRLPGLVLIAAGLLLNAVVVVANGAMPVSLSAARRAGVSTVNLATDPRHVAVDGQTRLNQLGEVISLPLPVAPAIVSPGDILVGSGLALFAAVAPVRARRTLDARRRARDPQLVSTAPDTPGLG